jgi:tetratricopeptide (TPR) repeat protein
MFRNLLSALLLIVIAVTFAFVWQQPPLPAPFETPRTVVEVEAPAASEDLIWESEPSFDQNSVDETPPPPLDFAAAQLNNEAVQLGSAGRFEQAVRRFYEALEIEPEHPILLRNLQTTLFNWGASELQSGDVDRAIDLLEEALRAGVTVETLNVLGSAYLQAGSPLDAAAVLEEAAAMSASNAQVLFLLGQAYIDLDRRPEALDILFRARDAGAPEALVGPLIERLGREVDAEWDFAVEETAHFRISFGDAEQPDTIDLIGHALERAYRGVGSKLGVYPTEQTPVVLYARQDFHSLTQTSGWAEGVFDGRIKIPVRGLDAHDPKVNRVLRHEYAHSLVARLGGRRVPGWVNEGIAMWAEEEADGDRYDWAAGVLERTHAVPLRHLVQSFARMPANQAQLAYAQSYLMIRSLVDRYGAGRLRQLLEELGRKRPLEEAFFDVYHRELTTVEREVFG